MEKAPDLTRSREFCIALIEAAPDALVVVDAQGRIVLWNAQAETMFGYSRDELLNQPIEMLVPDRFRASHTERRARYISAPKIRAMGSGPELIARRRDGSELPVEISLSPLSTRFGQLTIAVVRDATERRRTEEKLRYLGGHDTLTGLYNRHMFEEEQARLGRSRQIPVSTIVVDLDGLKEINDLLGHATGDEMLKRAASVLVQAFRAEDTVARIGGDEFAALLPTTGREAAAEALDRVERVLHEENAKTRGPSLSLSMGAATAERGNSMAESFREADRAMYKNKLFRQGRVR